MEQPFKSHPPLNPIPETINRFILMHWGGASFLCHCPKGLLQIQKAGISASHPITSATETLGCTGHSAAALRRTHSPWVVWLLQVFGHKYINVVLFKAANPSRLPWKNCHTSSLLSKILFLKLSKSEYCTIADCCGFPDSHRHSAIQSKAYALYSCFQLCCPRSISMLCCTAMIFSVLSVPRWQGVQPNGLQFNRHKMWAFRNQRQEGLFLTIIPKCFLSK